MPATIGGPSSSLFMPPYPPKVTGEWLRENFPLSVYEARLHKAVLIYKESSRMLKVLVPDGSIRTLLVDGKQTLKHVMGHICEKMNVKFPEEYGFISLKSGNVDLQEISINDKSKLFSSKALERRERLKKGPSPLWEHKKETFLDEDKTLVDHAIEEEDLLQMKKRFYFHDHFVTAQDYNTLRFTFLQAVQDILDGHYCVEMEHAVELAVFLLQFSFGDYSEKVFKSIDPAYYLPAEYLNDKYEKKAKKKVQDLWAKICKSKPDEKELLIKFMEITKEIADYGTKYLRGLEKISKARGVDYNEIAIGINRNAIIITDPVSRKVKAHWPLVKVKRFSATQYFIVDFGDHADKWLSLFTPHAKECVTLLSGYLRHWHQKRQFDQVAPVPSTEQLALEDAYVATEEVVNAEAQMISISQLTLPRNSLEFSDSVVVPQKPSYDLPLAPYVPKDPPCVANALVIKLKLPGDQEMAQLENDVIFSATALRCQTGDIQKSSLLDSMDYTGKDEAEWLSETLTICRKNVRRHLAPLVHAIIRILEQCSGLHGELDCSEVSRYVQVICDELNEFCQVVRLTAALLEEIPSVSLPSTCQDICEFIFSLLDNIPKPGQEDYYLANQLKLLERIGNKTKVIIAETKAEKIDGAFQEELAWSSNNVLTGSDSLLFNLIDRILLGLKDQPVPSKVIRDAVSKTYIAVKFLAIGASCLAPLIYTEDCKDLVANLANNCIYQIDILESTVKVSLQSPQMKSLLEFNCESVRDMLTKVTKFLENPPLLPDVVPASNPVTLPEIVAIGGKNAVADILSLLDQISASTLPNSPDYGDPSVPIKLSKQLNDATNGLIHEIRKRKRGIIWEQLIGDVTMNVGDLSNSMNLYGLSSLNIEDEDTKAEEIVQAMINQIAALSENLNEVDSMWDMS